MSAHLSVTNRDGALNLGWESGLLVVACLTEGAVHVTTGFLIFNFWSFAGDEDRANVNAMTLPASSSIITSPRAGT